MAILADDAELVNVLIRSRADIELGRVFFSFFCSFGKKYSPNF